ncbi:CYTH domain-containing protein [Streptomyces sp. WI04-05B]|uniref:CYTH domain-containing protein n=1 Tax=Streptomyces TaxID=1883 RepID=UPI0029A59D81|nr:MULTISPECIES: CYTH domain-containing protein [unclassified Streptomyces]MDX2544372.1 CYTH domain-containing protein [Streptomyces sp. WI04-05B]MDX2588559.1 CYTH domain-containing protein [Streptomyces sp. WI04-05A]
MAQNEYEAKFLEIDVEGTLGALRTAGAEQVFPKTTLTLKQVTDATHIHGTTEIEIEVDDLAKTAELLAALGLRQVRYQQNYREEWQLGGVTYDFDTWPDLPTFLEIEGPSEAAVKEAVAELGLDYGQARFGSIDLIYKSEVGRDILSEPTLLFT